MSHIKVTFAIPEGGDGDILIALLADAGYEGFEEIGNDLLAYISSDSFSEDDLKEIAKTLQLDYKTEEVAEQNWNQLWESNFQPVIVDGFCTIRAHFHDIEVSTPYEIIITPKMSFGTGHHATTQLVLTMMKDIDLQGRSVLDFGSGTGVLAIMAEKLGASDILAIDNDKWCMENAEENVLRNGCKHIAVRIGSLEEVPHKPVDVILANINRHILLQYMADIHTLLRAGGAIIMSGLLIEDKEVILASAADAGFVFRNVKELNGWIALLFEKL